MKEIIFTIISIINTVVFLVFVPRKIFTLSKRLDYIYANTDYTQFMMPNQLPDTPIEMIGRRTIFEREKFRINGLCLLQALIGLGALYLSGLEWFAFKAFTAVVGMFAFAVCIAMLAYYSKMEKRYELQNVNHRNDILPFFAPYIIALPIYQLVLLFL